MTGEQLRLFIRQAFALANREDSIIKGLDPTFLSAMARIRALVATLPPEDSIFRERAWKEMQPQVIAALGPYNDEFVRQLGWQLRDEAPEMAEEAVQMIEAVGVQPAPQVPSARAVPTDLGRLTLQDSIQATFRTQVNGRRVADLFERKGNAQLSDWMRSNQKAIDRVVVRGILEAQPTEEIAKGIATIIRRNGQEYISSAGSTAARSIEGDARAIARTAVQDANRQVHEAVYKANANQLDGLKWEWVAVLDSRTCPTCAPRDGQRWDTRAEAPVWPAHVNCRCRVVAVDPDEAADVRSGIQVSPERMTGERAYKTKVTVKGQRLYRRAEDVQPGKDGKPPNYADFLAQSNQKTQQMFFGGGNAGSIRAERFRKAVKSGVSPDRALRDLINTDKAGNRFKPVTL